MESLASTIRRTAMQLAFTPYADYPAGVQLEAKLKQILILYDGNPDKYRSCIICGKDRDNTANTRGNDPNEHIFSLVGSKKGFGNHPYNMGYVCKNSQCNNDVPKDKLVAAGLLPKLKQYMEWLNSVLQTDNGAMQLSDEIGELFLAFLKEKKINEKLRNYRTGTTRVLCEPTACLSNCVRRPKRLSADPA